ncbi:MAG: nucleotide exchange factor GrpE [Candidatus Nealsonbacteria bacterium]|nr:nucleotide exchange factor GrpE [Candidatus Nealsonbacteria bacterium]
MADKTDKNECQKQAEEYLAGWQRERANFLNYKKEEAKRAKEFFDYGAEELIIKLLPILDNLEIAEKNIPDDEKNNENVKGLLQIKSQLENFLKSRGVEEMKTMGERFDPNLHEVVGEIEIKDKESGVIFEEIQKGYKINGRIIRPARVKINK